MFLTKPWPIHANILLTTITQMASWCSSSSDPTTPRPKPPARRNTPTHRGRSTAGFHRPSGTRTSKRHGCARGSPSHRKSALDHRATCSRTQGEQKRGAQWGGWGGLQDFTSVNVDIGLITRPHFKVNKVNKVWDWRDWRPHPLNKNDDLMMDDEMRLHRLLLGRMKRASRMIRND